MIHWMILALCLGTAWYYAHKIVHPRTGFEGQDGEWMYCSTIYLTSVLDGVGGQRHTPAAFPPKIINGTHCTGGWVGPRVGPDGYGK